MLRQLCLLSVCAILISGCGRLPGSIEGKSAIPVTAPAAPVAVSEPRLEVTQPYADLRASTGAHACEAYAGPALPALKAWQGAEHNHSEFSDGDPGYTPVDYYAAGKAHGLAFMIGSEHSEDLDDGNYVTLSDQCLTLNLKDALPCVDNPTLDKLFKWEAIERMAEAAATPDYFTGRAFEYSPDRFGHINVLFSQNFSNYLWDASYFGTMDLFWNWFQRDPSTPGIGGSPTSPVPLGGGSDGLGIFNHPGDKCLLNTDNHVDPGCNWNGFEYIPGADERMVGIETFNTDIGRDSYHDYMVQALDKGWHLGSIGAEDLHHPIWGQPQLAKTVVIAEGGSLTLAGFKEALLARRFYALGYTNAARIRILADHQYPLGARMQCSAGAQVDYDAQVLAGDGGPFKGSLELIGSGGAVVASATGGTLKLQLPVQDSERWYFLRVLDPAGKAIAYSSPVWIRPKQ